MYYARVIAAIKAIFVVFLGLTVFLGVHIIIDAIKTKIRWRNTIWEETVRKGFQTDLRDGLTLIIIPTLFILVICYSFW